MIFCYWVTRMSNWAFFFIYFVCFFERRDLIPSEILEIDDFSNQLHERWPYDDATTSSLFRVLHFHCDVLIRSQFFLRTRTIDEIPWMKNKRLSHCSHSKYFSSIDCVFYVLFHWKVIAFSSCFMNKLKLVLDLFSLDLLNRMELLIWIIELDLIQIPIPVDILNGFDFTWKFPRI